jgi:hypothetical protein
MDCAACPFTLSSRRWCEHIAKLQQPVDMKSQGMLSYEEFTAIKAKLPSIRLV